MKARIQYASQPAAADAAAGIFVGFAGISPMAGFAGNIYRLQKVTKQLQ